MAQGVPGQFRKLVDFYPADAGYYTNGRWNQADGIIDQVYASVQPTSERDLKTLPEGRYQYDSYTLFSSYDGLVSYEETKTGDKVILNGEEYEVVAKRPWQNGVINHYKYIVAKLCS